MPAAKSENINCVFFGDGRCGHPAAPQELFRRHPLCVLCLGDKRIRKCTLQIQHERPMPPPLPPPPPLQVAA